MRMIRPPTTERKSSDLFPPFSFTNRVFLAVDRKALELRGKAAEIRRMLSLPKGFREAKLAFFMALAPGTVEVRGAAIHLQLEYRLNFNTNHWQAMYHLRYSGETCGFINVLAHIGHSQRAVMH
jgi:hypothetical protein